MLRAGLVVTIELAFGFGVASYIAQCSGPSSTTGIGECQSSLPASQFSSASRSGSVQLTVRYGSGTPPVASALGGLVTLHPVVAAPSLSSAGMVARLPSSPRYVGDTISVPVYAHTGPAAFALKGWSVRFQYNVNVLSLTSQQWSSVFQQPTSAHSPDTGVFAAVTTSLDPAYSNADVTGQDSLYIMTLSFRTLAGPASQSVLNGTIGAFVNQGTQRYLSDAPISFSDARGGLQPFGFLSVADVSVVGVLAYTATASLVNTAVLDGSAVQGQVRTLELFDRASSSSVLSSQYACTSEDPVVIDVFSASCTFVLVAQGAQGGAASIRVQTSNGTEVAQVPFLVWYPANITAHVNDAQLDRLQAVEARDNCSVGALYQEATISASAAFLAAGVERVDGLDVSGLVSFSSSNSSVAVLVGARVRGVAPGETNMQIEVASPTLSPGSIRVTVTDHLVSVTALRAAVVTGVTWTALVPTVVSWYPSNGTFTAQLQLQQSLTKEGDAGDLVAYAVFDDGSEQALPTTELTPRALTESLVLSRESSGWRVAVQVGAVRECGDLLAVEWRTCEQLVGAGAAPLNLRVPSVTGIVVVVVASRVAPPDDSAVLVPISLSSSSAVRVVAEFSDGSTRDFSSDTRVRIIVATGYTACATIGGINLLQVTAGAACSHIVVTASIPALAPGLNSSASVPLVRFAALQLQVLPYPSFSGYTSVQMSSLGRLGCTEYYQHGQMQLSARLSDASVTGVTSQGQVVSSTPTVLLVQQGGGAPWRLRPISSGIAVVNASFGRHSSVLSLPILDDEVPLSSIVFSVSGVTSANSNTFGATVGSTRTGSARVDFADGTRFSDASAIDWIPAGSLITFNSSDTSVVNVTVATGLFTLHSNWHTTVQLSATSACSDDLRGALDVAPNLEPATGDVDLGSSRGLQFQQSGSSVQVPVYANVADGVLVNYQIEVYFDSSVFRATGCTEGALSGFTCTTNDPPERVKLIATDTASTTGGSSVLLGSFTLRVLDSAVTLLYGTIVELVRNAYGTQTEIRTTLQSLFAGEGYADVRAATGTRRRLVGDHMSSLPLTLASSIRRSARRLTATACDPPGGCTAYKYGDVNGDCLLTSYDVLWARQIITGQRQLSDLCPWAQQQLDPTLDGQAATVEDAIYLQLATANKYRFLANVTVESSQVASGTASPLVVTASLVDDLSEPATDRTTVRYEIGYSLPGSDFAANAGLPVYDAGTSNGTAATTGNWLARSAHIGEGRYTITVRPAASWQSTSSPLGIAVMVETQDSFGVGEAERNFPFLGSSAEPYVQLAGGTRAFIPLRYFDVPPAPPPALSISSVVSLQEVYSAVYALSSTDVQRVASLTSVTQALSFADAPPLATPLTPIPLPPFVPAAPFAGPPVSPGPPILSAPSAAPPAQPPRNPPQQPPLPPSCPSDPALVADAEPSLSLLGPGLPIFGSAQQTSDDAHEQAFGFFHSGTPGSSGQVAVSVGQRAYGTRTYSW